MILQTANGPKEIKVADLDFTNLMCDLFHTQIGVGNWLDGGRRRVKKYLWSF